MDPAVIQALVQQATKAEQRLAQIESKIAGIQQLALYCHRVRLLNVSYAVGAAPQLLM